MISIRRWGTDFKLGHERIRDLRTAERFQVVIIEVISSPVNFLYSVL